MIELPCDWTVNRRPSTLAPSATAQSTESVAEEARSATTSTKDVPEAKSHDDSITQHPLGPWTPAAPRDTEETSPNGGKGRVKKLVLKQLTSVREDMDATSEAMVLDTESLIARLPYKRMLNDMFGGSLHGSMHTVSIPYVTRSYEESFMRERMHSSERECAKGPQCECMFIDRSQPFVGVEFLLPGEPVARTPHLCVLCCRATTQQLYYDVMFDKFEFPGTIQRFGNIHSQPGEYALDAMLIAVPSAPAHIMPLPIVSHQRNRYAVFVSGGIKRLRQTRVLFQSTPLRSADDGQ